jgi:hypothetical protein
MKDGFCGSVQDQILLKIPLIGYIYLFFNLSNISVNKPDGPS